MTMLITENIHAAEKLYQLAADMRDEAHCWQDRHVRSALHSAALQVDAAARQALHSSPTYADAWHEAASHYLAAHVVHRRFLESLAPLQLRARRPSVTLDCRDGVHGACAVCDCACHRSHR